MSKKIIKKISLILLITLSISFVGLNSAKAEDKIFLCKYEGKSENQYFSAFISYYPNTQKYLVTEYMYRNENDMKNKKNDTNITRESANYWNKLFSYKDENKSISMSKAVQKDLRSNGKCPTNAHINMPNHKICFDNGGNYCTTSKQNGKYRDISIYYSIEDYSDKLNTYKSTKPSDYSKYQKNVSLKINTKNYKTKANCEGILGDETIDFLQKIFNIVKIVAPLLVLGLTIFEFAKAVISQDQDALKKAGNLFVKRLIIMIVLFFLPTIINLLLELLDNSNGTCNVK